MSPSTLISAGTELLGRLTTDSDVHFAGRIQGEIATRGDLTVHAGARVDGALLARTVTIAGDVHGPVCGAERVEVLCGGSVAGDLRSACVVLAEGSRLDGRIEISD